MKVDYSKVADKVRFWKKIVESAKDFTGTSPPSIFVGKAFYPKVFVGILSPPVHNESANFLDSPEKWYSQKLSADEIMNLRGQLIYSRFQAKAVVRPSGRLEETTQEVAMASKPTDVEIELKKNPQFKFTFDSWVTPVGNPAPVLKARVTENPHVDRKVDYVVGDTDLKAKNAVVDLYKSGIDVSSIQKIFSAGLLGINLQRKFVPTRWSITAVDDTIGKFLAEEIKDFQELGEIRYFFNSYLDNFYHIILIPGPYQFELVESWIDENGRRVIGADYENHWGRKNYADNTHGAFYSGRLAAIEYLKKIRRQASVIIFREILPDYNLPVGIWQLREAVRDAFNKNYETFSTVDHALQKISTVTKTGVLWKQNSTLLKNLSRQTTLRKFYPSKPLS